MTCRKAIVMKASVHRRAFSLVELLVVITIIVMLVAMMGAAMNAARASGKKQRTKAAIAAIDAILQRHFASCESTPLSAGNATADIGVSIRRKISADMPDNWESVAFMKANPSQFATARQRSYVATYNALNPSPENGSAECLFMIVMQGGLADCLACTSLNSVQKGDTDNDGALEFLDDWGQPIRYVLWPAGFELPVGSKYFDQSAAPFSGQSLTSSVGGTMRPLVLSGGPDKDDTTRYPTSPPEQPYLELGNGCGVPTQAEIRPLGGLDDTGKDMRLDNITNYDDTVKK